MPIHESSNRCPLEKLVHTKTLAVRIHPHGVYFGRAGACELADDTPQSVDIIIPVYNERGDALSATLLACTQQSYAVSTIFVVDDGSLVPVALPDWAKASSQIVLLRLEQNQGISAARNAAIARSTSPLLACVNSEVLPDPDWVVTCADYLLHHPQLVPATPERFPRTRTAY